MRISAKPKKRIGNKALDVENLSKKYPALTLFEDINISLSGGEKVALIGPNGCGKTTLFSILAGDIQQEGGTFEFGQSAQPGFFYQEHSNLHMHNNLLQELWLVKPKEQESALRGYLGAFGFSGDDVLKEIGILSGGERSRLSLAKLLLEKHNFLLLDEPTNHIDIPSIEALEKFLADFPGTVLLISHDRSFMDAVADKVLAFEDGTLREYLGNYTYYREKVLENQTAEDEGEPSEKTQRREEFLASKKEDSKKKISQRRRTQRINEIEQILEKLEADKISLEKEMIDAANDYKLAQELAEKHKQLIAEIESLHKEWHELED